MPHSDKITQLRDKILYGDLLLGSNRGKWLSHSPMAHNLGMNVPPNGVDMGDMVDVILKEDAVMGTIRAGKAGIPVSPDNMVYSTKMAGGWQWGKLQDSVRQFEIVYYRVRAKP